MNKRDWQYVDAAKVDAESKIIGYMGKNVEIRQCVLDGPEGDKTISYIAKFINDELSVKDNPFIRLEATDFYGAVEEVQKYISYKQDGVRCIVPTNRKIVENGVSVVAGWSITGDCFSGIVEFMGFTQEFWGKTWDDFVKYFRTAAAELGIPGFGEFERVHQDLVSSPPSDPALVARILGVNPAGLENKEAKADS